LKLPINDADDNQKIKQGEEEHKLNGDAGLMKKENGPQTGK